MWQLGGSPAPTFVKPESPTSRSEQSGQTPLAEQDRPLGRLTGPVQVITRLADMWALSTDQLATLLDFDSRHDVNDLLQGVLTLKGRDRHDRVRNLFRIHEILDQLFRNDDVERKWLREPQDQLGRRSVLDLLLSGSIEQMILARRYVEHVAGR
jgi:uncharacterized protein (DUF2384 family)